MAGEAKNSAGKAPTGKRKSRTSKSRTDDAIELPETLNITVVADVRKQLVDSISTDKKTIKVNPGKINQIDTAGIQLLYAFRKKCEKNNIAIEWQPPSDAVENIIEILGMKQHLGFQG